MGLSTEKRLKSLEDQLKALKSTYSIYGGAMKTYQSVSQSFSWTSSWPIVIPIVKFTSDWERNKNILVASVNVEMRDNDDNLLYSPPELALDIQNHDGSINIHILPNIRMRSFRITLYSTSPGTFTRIQ